MKKQIVLAALVSLLAVAAVPSAIAADSGVTPANGNDYLLPTGDVYQLGDDGTYHWIPDVATANAMGLDWNALVIVDTLDAAVGDPFSTVVVLSNARVSTTAPAASPAAGPAKHVDVTPANGYDVIVPNGDVYQLGDDGNYHWIPNVATANAMNLAWDQLTFLDTLDAPVGDAFPSVVG